MHARQLLAALIFVPLVALAQDARPIEEVPYIRTPQAVVDKMLELAGVRGTDFLIDLGSGDGRVVITAAKRYGARGLGVELDSNLVAEATRRAKEAGVADRVSFEERDLFGVDLRPATVVTMYLLPEYNLRLRPKLLAQLRPGARVVSHDWDMGDWQRDLKAEIPVPEKPVGLLKSSNVYVWIVPARLEGRWSFAVAEGTTLELAEAHFEQKFQELGGTLHIGARSLPIERGVIHGSSLSFRVEDGGETIRFVGNATSDRIEGRIARGGGPDRPWRALREAGGS